MKIALAQNCATDDFEKNLQQALTWAKEAQAEGAELITFPESFLFIGNSPLEYLEIAEPLDGPIIRQFQALAKEIGIEMLLGGFCEANLEDPSKTYNTALWINGQGEVQSFYRKIHLFDSKVEGANLRESATVCSGQDIVSFDHPKLGIVGLSICYDLRFPCLYQRLRDQGAKVIFIPAAFTAQTGVMHWQPLLQARAIENQVFVIAPGQTGQHNKKRNSYGHSLAIDPWGQILLDAGSEVALTYVKIDLTQIAPIRKQMPVVEHRVQGVDYA